MDKSKSYDHLINYTNILYRYVGLLVKQSDSFKVKCLKTKSLIPLHSNTCSLDDITVLFFKIENIGPIPQTTDVFCVIFYLRNIL